MGPSDPGRENHSHLVDGRRHHLWTDRLWELASRLPVEEVAIADIAEFDQDCWFHGRAPTCRQVADHARRIQAADLSYPVLLTPTGSLMDGGHRLAKAWLAGQTHVRAVRFPAEPPPDWITDDQPSPENVPAVPPVKPSTREESEVGRGLR